MNRDCKCDGHICSYINFDNFAECCDCHTPYILENGKWKKVSKIDFRIMYRQALIEFQNSNKDDKL